MFSYRILIVFIPILYNCFLIGKSLYFHRWLCAENTMKIQAVFLKYSHNTIHRRNLPNIPVVFLSYCHKFYVSWEYNDNPVKIRQEFRDDFRWVVFLDSYTGILLQPWSHPSKISQMKKRVKCTARFQKIKVLSQTNPILMAES